MRAPISHPRSIAVFVILSFFSLQAAGSLPLTAGDQDASPAFVEKAGGSPLARLAKSRFLPTLIGLAVAGAVVAVLVLTVFKKTGYNPHIIPLDFVQGVTHPYFPLVAGQTRRYAVAGGEDGLYMTVEATANTKSIMGILCLGVQDRVLNTERLFEDTWRWYAQDEKGNVWLFARETKIYDYDTVTEDWAWEAGVAGAKPGMVMVGRPEEYLGKEYREEYVPGVAEDRAVLISMSETVTVPYGTFSDCLKIKVYSDLDPGRFEFRYYASGIGLVLSETMPEGKRRLELVSIGAEPPAEPLRR